VLGLTGQVSVGVHDDFFALGGDSVLTLPLFRGYATGWK
jgi:hypothetical protein